MGGDPSAMVDEDGDGVDDRGEAAGGMPTMEEMMREAMGDDEDAEEAPEPDTTE
jgi:hypothetical protein